MKIEASGCFVRQQQRANGCPVDHASCIVNLNSMYHYYAPQVFGKALEDLTIDDLEAFFQKEQEESDTFEFKSAPLSLDKLYKEVTAFLNTSGGILILGSPREQTVNGQRVAMGDVTFDTENRSREDYQRKLATHITPPPVGIRIQHCRTEQGSVYVFDIPQSDFAPHQSGDGIYYIRIGESSRPAPHGIVAALFDRRRRPLLEARISVESVSEEQMVVTLAIANESSVTAEQVGCFVDMAPLLEVYSEKGVRRVNRRNNDLFHDSEAHFGILVKGITSSIRYHIRHYGTPFLTYIGTWCKDGELRIQTFRVDPATGEIGTVSDSRATDSDATELFWGELDRCYEALDALPPLDSELQERMNELGLHVSATVDGEWLDCDVTSRSVARHTDVEIEFDLLREDGTVISIAGETLDTIGPGETKQVNIRISNNMSGRPTKALLRSIKVKEHGPAVIR